MMQSVLNILAHHPDPRLRPQSAMPRVGGKNIAAYQVTNASHPELMKEYTLLCSRAGFSQALPLIFIERDDKNVMAQIFHKQIYFFSGALKVLNMDETLGIAGHELAHIKHTSKTSLLKEYALTIATYAATLAAGMWGIVHAAKTSQTKSGGFLKGLGISVASLIPPVAVANLTVRPRELQADAEGAEISGRPGAFLSGLEKIEGHRSGIFGKALSILGGYPTYDERIHYIQKRFSVPPNTPAPNITEIAAAEKLQDSSQRLSV